MSDKIKNKFMEIRKQFLENSSWIYEEKANGHVRVFTDDKVFDVWLSTGKWTEVGTNKYHQGWKNFVKMIDELMIDELSEG